MWDVMGMRLFLGNKMLSASHGETTVSGYGVRKVYVVKDSYSLEETPTLPSAGAFR